MQYLLLICDDERKFTKMPEAQLGQVMREFAEFTQDIVKSGHFRAGAQLQPVSTATTVREQNGKAVTIDGPFAETKEQMGGYYLVECKNLDEAIGLAKRIPSVRLGGSIEIRPLAPMSEAATRSAG